MTGFAFPPGFLWGAATAPHQVEGGNVNSDWWAREERGPGMQLSGDACDSIAAGDDARRVAYTRAALASLGDAVADGADVRGYLHWSLLDKFEWGHWEPTFGLVATARETFARTPKPSLAWLGGIAWAGKDS